MKRFLNKKLITVLILSIITFLYLMNNYNNLFVRNIDESMLNWLLANTNVVMVYIFELITILANWQSIILCSLILLYLVQDKMLVLLVTHVTGFSFVINETIKNTLQRPRPNVMQLTSESGYSMPSGHALAATIFYGLIIVLFISKIEDKRYRNLVSVLFSILIVLIGLSRIYLRVHYVSDVIAGIALGIIILSFVYFLKVGIFDNIRHYIEGEKIE